MTDSSLTVTFGSLGYMGELGNQMFQIAAVTAYAAQTGKQAVFPVWKCHISGRNYTDIFQHSLDQSYDPQEQMMKNVVRKYYMDLKYVPMPVVDGNVDFAGYFQSEKYFEEIADKVRAMFQPTEKVSRYIKANYKDLLEYDKKVSLHVRTAKRAANDSDVHASCTREFIEQAMEDFKDKDLFVVFADNMEEAKKILPEGKSYLYIENEENYIDLFLMTEFDSYIVSPSTFGWWGAWLSKHPNPRVTVMQDWFAKDKAKAYLNDNDIIPDRWKKI